MQIQFIGHNVEVTPALKDYTANKFERLERHTSKITSIHVTFTVDKLQQIAEATIHVPKAEIHASAKSENMYNAIVDLVEKLIRQLDKHIDELQDHHGG